MVIEEEVKQFITSWLKPYNVEVYWEKKNKWNYPIFSKDGKAKPDLVIKRNNICFAVEVKTAKESDSIALNSFQQIIKYAIEEQVYYIDTKPILISGFLVATQNSIKGHLFNKEEISEPSRGRKWSIEHGETPETEYNSTKLFIRTLWRNAQNNGIGKPIGCLLSNKLNNRHSIAPLLFYKAGKSQKYEVWI